jgi:hypothetical protein
MNALWSFTDVSCLDTSNCVAVGDGLNGGLAVTSANGGATWVNRPLPPNVFELYAISCAAPSFCVAVGEPNAPGYAVILVSSDSGHHWIDHHVAWRNPSLVDVSCSTPSNCIVVGDGGDNASGYTGGLAWRTDDGGHSWQRSAIAPASDYVASVSCSSPTRCVAVGSGTSAASASTALVLTSFDGGLSWHRDDNLLNEATLSDVQCEAPLRCLAVGSKHPDEHWLTAGVAATSLDGGLTWSVLTLPKAVRTPEGVSCSTALDCRIVGSGNGGAPNSVWATESTSGEATATTDGGLTWTGDRLPWGLDITTAAACPSASMCVVSALDVADGRTHLLVTRDGAKKWSDWIAPRAVGGLEDIACTDTRHCVAVGSLSWTARAKLGYVALQTNDSGRTWSVHQGQGRGAGFDAVSCASALECYAAQGSSNPKILRSTNGGATWRLQGSSPGYSLSGMSCGAPERCWTYFNTDGFQGLYQSHDGGRRWVVGNWPANVGFLSDFRCVTAVRCVGLASTSVASRLLVTRNAGASWRELRMVADSDLVLSLSCTRTLWCGVWAARPSGAIYFAHTGVGLSRTTSLGIVDAAIQSRAVSSVGVVGTTLRCPSVHSCLTAFDGLSPTLGVELLYSDLSRWCTVVGATKSQTYRDVVERWEGRSWTATLNDR